MSNFLSFFHTSDTNMENLMAKHSFDLCSKIYQSAFVSMENTGFIR